MLGAPWKRPASSSSTERRGARRSPSEGLTEEALEATTLRQQRSTEYATESASALTWHSQVDQVSTSRFRGQDRQHRGKEHLQPGGFAAGINGRSASEPMLISSYGSGARPKVETNATQSTVISNASDASNSTGHYIAIIGIEFYCYDRNPSDPRFNSNATYWTNEPGAIGWHNAAYWALFEDNKISFYDNGIGLQPFGSGIDANHSLGHINPQVRRRRSMAS